MIFVKPVNSRAFDQIAGGSRSQIHIVNLGTTRQPHGSPYSASAAMLRKNLFLLTESPNIVK